MTAAVPQLASGTWVIDPVHSAIVFSVRHLGLAAARGGFNDFSGEIVVGEDSLAAQVRAEIRIASLNTFNEARDGHLRTADFFDADGHPTAVFASTGVSRASDEEFVVKGELTLKGVTKAIELQLTYNGTVTDPQSGAEKAGFVAVTEILRSDFGVGNVMSLPNGSLAIADKVRIELDIEAALAS